MPWEEAQTAPADNRPPWEEAQGAPSTPQPAPMFSGKGFSQALDTVKASPLFNSLMPTNLLQSAPDALHRVGDWAGNFISENLGKPDMRENSLTGKMYNANPITPEVAAGAGFAAKMAPDVAMTVGAPGVLEGQFEKPGFAALGRWGARQVNNAAGIQPNTIVKMAGSQNPARVGENLGRSLVDEGAFGTEAGSTFDKAKEVMNKFGSDVQSAIDAIKNTGQPVSLDAETALQPIVDAWANKSGSALQANRALAKPFEEIYGKLAEAAKANGGQLGLDDLRAAMDETGEALGSLAKDSPKRAAYSELYAKLADTRDQMVSQIADRAGDPNLRGALLKANEGYSRYSRIMPDIRKAAARTAVGQSSVPLERAGIFNRMVDTAQPFLAKAAVKLGGAASPAPIFEPTANATTMGAQELQGQPPKPIFSPTAPKAAPPPLFRRPLPKAASAKKKQTQQLAMARMPLPPNPNDPITIGSSRGELGSEAA